MVYGFSIAGAGRRESMAGVAVVTVNLFTNNNQNNLLKGDRRFFLHWRY